MRGSYTQRYAASILLCILVAIQRPEMTKAAYTMNETCLYIYNGYIGDPTNCQNWGYCEGGKLVTVQSCAKGLLFDSRSSMCNYPQYVSCSTTLENVCQLSAEPGYFGDPNNCNRYCYCSNGASSSCFNCPQYQVFNPNSNTCVWGKEYSCSANSICRLVANNVFAEDPIKCGNYIRCQDGSGVSRACADGSSKFNPRLNGCDPNYKCVDNPNSPNDPTQPQPSLDFCKTKYDTTKLGTQYFTDSTTCYGYFECKSATATATWGSCPLATHFNPNLQKCVTPYTYDCPYNRCGNMQTGFMAMKGCLGYWVCTNGQNTSSALCSDYYENAEWFNEYDGGCTPTEPKGQAICQVQ